MQRVHIDDLTGFLLGQSDEWDVFSMPAVAYSDEDIPLSAKRAYWRKQLAAKYDLCLTGSDWH
jgi:hypothetical protein